MIKIYTKLGDSGTTSIYAGIHTKKNSKIINALGSIDELNSFIGFAWNVCGRKNLKKILEDIQKELYELNAELAGYGKMKITSEKIKNLEILIDKFIATKKLKAFVRPGERGEFSARIHICRTVCRRAEREVVTLASTKSSNYKYILQYLNRLGDLLFSIAELK